MLLHATEIRLDPDNGTPCKHDSMESTIGDNTTHAKKGFIVAVTSTTGGAGKTTVAVALAQQIVENSKQAVEKQQIEQPLTVCIVDLDVYDGQLSYLVWSHSPNALTLSLDGKPLSEYLVRNNLIYVPKIGAHVLLAPGKSENVNSVNAEFYTKTINILQNLFDVVILDNAPVFNHGSMFSDVSFPLADSVLLVSGTTDNDVYSLKEWSENHPETSKVAVVFNRVPEHNDPFSNMFGSLPVLTYIPSEEIFINASYVNGWINQISTHPTIGPAFYDLAEHVLDIRKSMG